MHGCCASSTSIVLSERDYLRLTGAGLDPDGLRAGAKAIAMRMIIVAGLLMIALLGAVLSSVGGHHPLSVYGTNQDNDDMKPLREISRQALPASFGRS